jgi:hypothetical protein
MTNLLLSMQMVQSIGIKIVNLLNRNQNEKDCDKV